MGFSKYTLGIALRLALIFLAMAALARMAGQEARLFSVIAISLILVLLILELFRKITRTNRILESLLTSVRHGETDQAILDEAGGLGFRELAQSAQLIIASIASARIEKELQFRYLQALLDHIHTAVITLGDQGEPELVNPLALKTLGIYHSRKPAWRDIEKASPEFARTILEMGEGGREMIPLENSAQGRSLLILMNRVRIGDRPVRIITFQDIEPEIGQKETESWYTISRIMAHEIMNSLTPLSSLTETGIMMLRENGRPRDVSSLSQEVVDNLLQALQTISDRNRALSTFIENYRRLSRLPMPETEPLRVAELLREIAGLYAPELEARGIRFTLKTGSASRLSVLADHSQLKQVLINLVKNGAEALEGTEGPRLELSARRVLDHCRIEVSDNGPGIPPDQRHKIFVPFFSTKPDGSGIGLSLSRQIVLNHRGQLHVRSDPGRETIFRISLPVYEQKKEPQNQDHET